MNLTNQFLIAMPSLADPNFHRTVTYMCAHSEEGAMGIVINRPLELTLEEMLGHMDIEMDIESPDAMVAGRSVFQGGPVCRERGFVLHRPPGQWDATLRVSDEIAVATSRDILQALAQGTGPADSLIALGYAGWAAGQLEQEVLQNAWLSGPAASRILFDVPYEQRWDEAARLLGVEIDRIHGEAGHA